MDRGIIWGSEKTNIHYKIMLSELLKKHSMPQIVLIKRCYLGNYFGGVGRIQGTKQ